MRVSVLSFLAVAPARPSAVAAGAPARGNPLQSPLENTASPPCPGRNALLEQPVRRPGERLRAVRDPADRLRQVIKAVAGGIALSHLPHGQGPAASHHAPILQAEGIRVAAPRMAPKLVDRHGFLSPSWQEKRQAVGWQPAPRR